MASKWGVGFGVFVWFGGVVFCVCFLFGWLVVFKQKIFMNVRLQKEQKACCKQRIGQVVHNW